MPQDTIKEDYQDHCAMDGLKLLAYLLAELSNSWTLKVTQTIQSTTTGPRRCQPTNSWASREVLFRGQAAHRASSPDINQQVGGTSAQQREKDLEKILNICGVEGYT